MTIPVVLLDAAEADLAEARGWYRNCRPSLEADFDLCVEHALERITRNPLAHPAVYSDFRRTLVRRFPYRVFFRLAGDRIIVVAVMHSRRDPRAWQARNH